MNSFDERAIPDLKSEAIDIRAASELFAPYRYDLAVIENSAHRQRASGTMTVACQWSDLGLPGLGDNGDAILTLFNDGVVRSTAAVAKHVGLFSVSHAGPRDLERPYILA